MTTSSILSLNGDVDGVNRVFTTPSEYVGGTLRLIWNGQVIAEPGDELQGWVETPPITITTDIAPQVGDTLQAFYREIIELEGVVGSPFHPNNAYP